METKFGKVLPGVGIDLGTTNSVISYVVEQNGKIKANALKIPRLAEPEAGLNYRPRQLKKETLPSCVYYPMENNFVPVVGDYAKSQYPLRPQLVAKSIKSQMGNEFTQGLADEVPDKTPAEVSSQIVKYLKDCASKLLQADIPDVVVTVPANFDAAQRKATLEAVEKAGLRIKNDDGTEKLVLLSEPKAVMFELINKIQNMELANTLINLEKPQNILVFDLGGGTLDITLHNVKSNNETNVVTMDEIATNRYTLLGGDNFDMAIAEDMFNRFLSQNMNFGDEVINKLKKDKAKLMPLFITWAEKLKIDLGEMQSNKDIFGAWGSELPPQGGPLGNGFSYDDTYTQEEVEAVLDRFMGNELKFEDYPRVNEIKNRDNIIYPILDVLYKAEQKLGKGNVKIDAVVLNGGMTQFYMVVNRLKAFFDLEPIPFPNPDFTVAQGAAICHYYLQKNKAVEANMYKVGDVDFSSKKRVPVASELRPFSISLGKTILNDALYLGLQNGAKELELIATGQELPYVSDKIKGFVVDANNKRIGLPIRSMKNDGTMYTVGTGMITLSKAYPVDTYASIVVEMTENKVLTMKAWISKDIDGHDVIDTADCTFEIGQRKVEQGAKKKLAAPLGSTLNPANELQMLFSLCNENNSKKGKQGSFNEAAANRKLSNLLCGIKNCANKADFAQPVLNELRKMHRDYTVMRLLTLSRSVCSEWNDKERKELAKFCMECLAGEFYGFHASGLKVSLNIEAIYLLGEVGSKADMERLKNITNPKYQQSLCYAYAKSGTNVEFVNKLVLADIEKHKKGNANTLQHSAYAMGMAVSQDLHDNVVFAGGDVIVEKLCSVLSSADFNGPELNPVILALGCICDQRYGCNLVSKASMTKAIDAINSLESQADDIVETTRKSRNISAKMINGATLEVEEQYHLLRLINCYAS